MTPTPPRQTFRIDEAREALRRAMPRIAPVRRVGLLTYGPGGADSCGGIGLHLRRARMRRGPDLRARLRGCGPVA